jgi:hypothetical protein
MRRIGYAIRLIDGACSIAVSLRGCADGQEHKMELSLERAEIGEAVEAALHRRIKTLRALRGSEHFRKDFLALVKEEGLKIDPATAEMIWTQGDALDPYALGPESPFQPDTLCFVYSPGKTNCVWIGDLPIETREALRLKRAAKQSGSVAAPEIANPPDGRRGDPDALAGPPWLLPFRRALSERAASQLQNSES